MGDFSKLLELPVGDTGLLLTPFVGVEQANVSPEPMPGISSGTVVNLVRRENTPFFGSHWKYLMPVTEPSFFPKIASVTGGNFVAGTVGQPFWYFMCETIYLFTQHNNNKAVPRLIGHAWLAYEIPEKKSRSDQHCKLPMGSSRTMPAQSPGANWVSPMKAILPGLVPPTHTRCPMMKLSVSSVRIALESASIFMLIMW